MLTDPSCSDACGASHVSAPTIPDNAGDPELEAMLADPTLESCCRRDLLQQKRSAVLRSKLLAVDRTEQRLQLRTATVAIGHAVHAQQQEEQASPLSECSFASEDDELDPELQRLRQMRLQQLQSQQVTQDAVRREGYGRLNDVPCTQLLKVAEEVRGCCVCHLAVEGAEACSHLDEALEGFAHRFRRTFFMRCFAPTRGQQASQVKGSLGLATLPALVSFRDGAIIGRSHLEMFGPPGEILEEEVEAYLKRLGVLKLSKDQAGPAAGGRGKAAEASSDEGSESEDSSSKAAPCEVCGRCYPHEHVRAVYRTMDEQDPDDDD